MSSNDTNMTTTSTIKVGTAIAHMTTAGDLVSTRYEFLEAETTRSWKKAWEITEEFCDSSRDEWKKVKTVCGDMLLVCVVREVIQ